MNMRGDDTTRHSRAFIWLILGSYLFMLLIGSASERFSFLLILFTLIVHLGVMIAYKNYCSNQLKLSKEETGDSLYYMGFLFTATSLAAGLTVIGFRLQGTPDQGTPGEAIISFLPAFGTALLTTIVGLAWRVVLSQGEGDISEEYSHMKEELHKTAIGLTNQCNMVTERLNVFVVAIQQKITELEQGFRKFSGAMDAAYEGGQIEKAADALQGASDRLHTVASEFSTSSREFSQQLNPSIRGLDATAKELAVVGGDWASTSKGLTQGLQDQSKALEKVSDRLREDRNAKAFQGVREQSSMSDRAATYGLSFLAGIGLAVILALLTFAILMLFPEAIPTALVPRVISGLLIFWSLILLFNFLIKTFGTVQR